MLPSMSNGQWATLALLAIGAFWMVGAYNRLVALRNVISQAYAQVDELVQRRTAAAESLIELARPEMASEQAALDAWLSSQQASRQASRSLRERPVVAARAAALTAAEPALAAATARVMALLEQHPGVMATATVAAHLATLRETEARLTFARQVYNEAAQTYNDAVRLFPTRLLARLYGFGTAGRL